MQIVENASKLYKAWSVILPVLGIIFSLVIVVLQELVKLEVLNATQIVLVNGCIYALTAIARYIKQRSVSG